MMISEKLLFIITLLIFLLYRYVYGLARSNNDYRKIEDLDHKSLRCCSSFETHKPFPDQNVDDVAIEDYPYHLSVVEDDSTPVCSAVLLTSRWAVMPFHCAIFLSNDDQRKPRYKIRTDKHKNNFEIQRIVHHPDFNPLVKKNDIALIKFKYPIPFDDYVRPACLISVEDEEKRIYQNFKMIGISGLDTSFKIKNLDVEEANSTIGKRTDFEYKMIVNQERRVCIIDKTPLLIGKSPGANYVIGLFSFQLSTYSNLACTDNLFGQVLFFTRLSYFTDWISGTIDDSFYLKRCETSKFIVQNLPD